MAPPVIAPAEQGLQDWLYLPALGTAATGLSLLLIGLLGLCVVASLWIVRVPGPLTPAERQRSRVVQGLLGAMAVGGPVLIGLAIAYLHFPVAPPKVVILSSRARTRGTKADAEWSRRWSQLLAATHAPSALDAGEIVDDVCRALAENPPAAGWRRGDPQVVQHIRDVAFALIAPRVRSTANVPADREHTMTSSSSGLPPWVVESVELAVLKALTQARNVSHLYVLCEPRVTLAGPTWSGSVLTYLGTGATRLKPALVYAEAVSAREPVTLQAFPSVLSQGGRMTATLYFRVDHELAKSLGSSEWDEARTVVLHTSEHDGPGQPFLVGTLNRDQQIQACSVELPKTEVEASAYVVHLASGQRLPWPAAGNAASSRDAGAQPPITLVCTGETETSWRTTLDELFRFDSGFATWRRDMRESLLLPIPETADRIRIATTAPASGVVIDTRREGVWVYDARLRDEVAKAPKPRPLDESRAKLTHRVEAGNAGPPGPYAWDGVQLPIGDRYRLPRRGGDGDIARALGRAEDLYSGLLGQYPEPPDPLVNAFPLSSTDEQRPGSGLVTCLGLIPDRHGLIAKPDGGVPENFDRARFLAFWTSVFQGVQCAPLSTSKEIGAADNTVNTEPTILLTAAQLSNLRAGAVRLPLIWLGVGMSMFAGWVLFSRWLGVRRTKG